MSRINLSDNMKCDAQLSLRVPYPLKETLQRMSQKQGRSLSRIAADALTIYFNNTVELDDDIDAVVKQLKEDVRTLEKRVTTLEGSGPG